MQSSLETERTKRGSVIGEIGGKETYLLLFYFVFFVSLFIFSFLCCTIAYRPKRRSSVTLHEGFCLCIVLFVSCCKLNWTEETGSRQNLHALVLNWSRGRESVPFDLWPLTSKSSVTDPEHEACREREKLISCLAEMSSERQRRSLPLTTARSVRRPVAVYCQLTQQSTHSL